MHGWLKSWKVPEGGANEALRGSLVQRIAAARGIAAADIARFTAPTFADLCPPEAFPGAVAVGMRLTDAVRAGRRLAIYGDYDADGMCAAAILVHIIRQAGGGPDTAVHIPSRATEGYGVSVDALRQLAAHGTEVVVTVDCGITAVEEIALGRSLGMEMLVTDHHALREDGVLPAAHAIAHPALDGGDGLLCGAGVAWKVAQAFARAWCRSDRVTSELREVLVETLALAAFGTVADIVPLIGENRVLTHLGARRIAQSGLPGLRALAEQGKVGPRDRVDGERIAFGLAPVLNACGRLGSALDGARLLSLPRGDAASEAAARQLVRHFAALNERRKADEREIFEQALDRVDEGLGSSRGAFVLADPSWSRGIVGTACARVVERLHLPGVLMQSSGRHAQGSARSIDGYSILGGLHACAQHLDRFGGHSAAAGVSVSLDRLEAFRESLSGHAAQHRPSDAGPTVRAEVCLCDSDVSVESFEEVERLGPFGRDFPAPVVLARAAVITSHPRVFGKDNDHISFYARVSPEATTEVPCTWWRQAGLAQRLTRGRTVHIVGTPKVDSWGSRPTRPALAVLDVADAT